MACAPAGPAPTLLTGTTVVVDGGLTADFYFGRGPQRNRGSSPGAPLAVYDAEANYAAAGGLPRNRNAASLCRLARSSGRGPATVDFVEIDA